jgi:hypothetical protein
MMAGFRRRHSSSLPSFLIAGDRIICRSNIPFASRVATTNVAQEIAEAVITSVDMTIVVYGKAKDHTAY